MREAQQYRNRSNSSCMESSGPARLVDTKGAVARSATRGSASLLIGLGAFALASLLALPAQAQSPQRVTETGVANKGQTSASGSVSASDYHAQAFTTGSRSYQLEHVEVEFATAATGNLDQVRVQLRRATGGEPGSTVAEFSHVEVKRENTNFPKLVTFIGTSILPVTAGVNEFRRYGINPVVLEANTTYFLVIWSGLETTTASLKTTASDAQDSGGRSGWTIADDALKKERYGSAWTSNANALKIHLEVSTNRGFRVEDASAHEGPDATLDFRVTLDNPPSGSNTASVTYGTKNITARVGYDFEWTSGTLTFRAGEREKTVSVPVIDDSEDDDGETMEFLLINSTDRKIIRRTATGTIRNSEGEADASALSVADAEATEGEDDTLDFVVTLDPVATATVTVDYATADVTATAGDDYTAASGTLTFDPGDTTKTIAVPITDDTVEDDGETLTLTLSNASGAELGDAEATGTIRNTETLPDTEGETESGALTAAFEDLPDAHDGTGAFTFRVEFSEAVDTSYTVMRDTAFTVAGGEVTRARRVDGRSDLWEITVEPDSDAAVTVTLPGDRACGASGAVCTADDAQLSNSPSATVAGPGEVGEENEDGEDDSDSVVESEPETEPLTARFEGVPASHGGPGVVFTFRVRFSEAPDVSYVVLRDQAFSVSGGTVRRARRVDGREDLREIHVEASTWGAVSLTLQGGRACGSVGAICTDDNRNLSNSQSATIQGPTTLSVGDANVAEGAGATVKFQVSLGGQADGTVTVDYATADGTATAGEDYTATSGTLSFASGETEKTVSVTVLDDAHDEGSETFSLGNYILD